MAEHLAQQLHRREHRAEVVPTGVMEASLLAYRRFGIFATCSANQSGNQRSTYEPSEFAKTLPHHSALLAIAIQTATKNAAALLHLDDRGIIAPGKLADLLVVDGDPSKDISAVDNIDSVWRRGKKVADGRWFKPRRPKKPA